MKNHQKEINSKVVDIHIGHHVCQKDSQVAECRDKASNFPKLMLLDYKKHLQTVLNQENFAIEFQRIKGYIIPRISQIKKKVPRF